MPAWAWPAARLTSTPLARTQVASGEQPVLEVRRQRRARRAEQHRPELAARDLAPQFGDADERAGIVGREHADRLPRLGDHATRPRRRRSRRARSGHRAGARARSRRARRGARCRARRARPASSACAATAGDADRRGHGEQRGQDQRQRRTCRADARSGARASRRRAPPPRRGPRRSPDRPPRGSEASATTAR